MPGSIIFVVIVAIWAAYLIQHWVRRREHLATARSVDKFSEAMRVLERRAPLPATELTAPRPHSYAVKPPSARPAVVVKRASSVEADVEGREPMRVAASSAHRTLMWRRVRGVALLVTLVAIPVTALLSALHVLKWVSVAIAAAAFIACVAALVVSARRERAARSAARRTAREAPLGVQETSGRTGSTATRGGSGAKAGSREVAARAAARPDAQELNRLMGALQEAPVARPKRDVVFDDDAAEPGVAAAVVARAPSGADVARSDVAAEGGWSPVPVPPPTYTLKEPAVRRTSAGPAPAADGRPVPIEVDDWAPGEGDDLLEATRRQAIGG